MRKKILEALNTKFPGVSDNKLNRIVDNLVKKIKSEEEIQSAVDEITVESLLDSYGDARANLSRDSIIRDYETKHNLKDGKSTEFIDEDKLFKIIDDIVQEFPRGFFRGNSLNEQKDLHEEKRRENENLSHGFLPSLVTVKRNGL